MRTIRYTSRVYPASKWRWCGVVNSYTKYFTTSMPLCLVSRPTLCLHNENIMDEWDAFQETPALQKAPEFSPEKIGLPHIQDVLSTGDSVVASNISTLDITVIDARGVKVDVTPIQYFSDLTNTPDWLSKGLQALAYPSTTPIQGHTIPILEQGHDLVGLAPTGSGKTVAFAVPALKRFQPSPDGLPTIVVLAPTRELVQQTARVFHQLGSGAVRVCEAYGGAPRETQARRLQNGCDVLIACPGRLKDFLQSGDVSLDRMSFLVFDEADRLLDMGFKIQLDEILSYADSSRPVQTMMWSATWPKSVEVLACEYLSEGRYTIRAGTAGTDMQVNEKIRQHILFAGCPEDRMEALLSLIKNGTIDENTAKMMIFVERQIDTERVALLLAKMLGIHVRNVGVIHGGMQQRQRDYIMSNFKQSRTRILVATDVASRGIDFPDVTCVVNFMPPKNIDSYCHRIGRTGRAGRTGDAFTFIGRSDGPLARDLVGYLEKCGMMVPQQLAEIAEQYTQYEEQRRSKRSWGGRPGRGYKDRQRGSNGFSSQDSGW